jgi:CHASE3 domain sensor protein
MREERSEEIILLSDRISAQTAAAVEFSNALVKIIEQTAFIRDKINHTNDFLSEEYRNLKNKTEELILKFEKYSGENSNRHNSIGRDLEHFKSSLLDFESKINIVIQANERSDAILASIHQDSPEHSRKIMEQLNKMNEDVKASINKINAQIEAQNENVNEFKQAFDRFKYFLVALGIMITLFGTLKTFNIIDISWLMKR